MKKGGRVGKKGKVVSEKGVITSLVAFFTYSATINEKSVLHLFLFVLFFFLSLPAHTLHSSVWAFFHLHHLHKDFLCFVRTSRRVSPAS